MKIWDAIRGFFARRVPRPNPREVGRRSMERRREVLEVMAEDKEDLVGRLQELANQQARNPVDAARARELAGQYLTKSRELRETLAQLEDEFELMTGRHDRNDERS